MDNILKQTMLQQCVLVKSEWDTLGSAKDANHGLCEHIKYCGDYEDRHAIQRVLRECFRLWPEYSGDPAYPVSHPDDEDIDAERAYNKLNLWTGPYGEARKRLLDFIIQTLSEELHNAV